MVVCQGWNGCVLREVKKLCSKVVVCGGVNIVDCLGIKYKFVVYIINC